MRRLLDMISQTPLSTRRVYHRALLDDLLKVSSPILCGKASDVSNAAASRVDDV